MRKIFWLLFQGLKEDILYINMCSWKRVPAATSYSDTVPVYGGRMEKVTEEKGTKTPSHHFLLTKDSLLGGIVPLCNSA